MTLHCVIDGAADAPPLVLLHAIATSSALWQPQIGLWGSRYRVLRLDLPGHGASPPLPPGAGFADFADAVAQTLARHDVRNAAVVGLSFGAMIAVQLATRHPALVRAAVLANCVAKTPPPVRQAWLDRIAAVEADGMAGQIAGTLDRWFTPGFAAQSPATLGWIGGVIAATPPAGFVGAAQAIASLDQLDVLPHMTCPVLVLSGAHDQAAPPAAMQDIAACLPQSRFQSLDAAHLSSVEAPTAFGEAVCAFLDAP